MEQNIELFTANYLNNTHLENKHIITWSITIFNIQHHLWISYELPFLQVYCPNINTTDVHLLLRHSPRCHIHDHLFVVLVTITMTLILISISCTLYLSELKDTYLLTRSFKGNKWRGIVKYNVLVLYRGVRYGQI